MIKVPTYDFVQDKYCSWCSTIFTEQNNYPRKCFRCGNDTYKNPIPVIVAIVPIINLSNHSTRWLIQQRNNNPKGGWAFPGGYINLGETWQQAAVRELQEEVGLITQPEDYNLIDVLTAANDNMIIFAGHKGVYQDEINFTPNYEVSAISFPDKPNDQELCFPTHNEVWKFYYSSNKLSLFLNKTKT